MADSGGYFGRSSRRSGGKNASSNPAAPSPFSPALNIGAAPPTPPKSSGGSASLTSPFGDSSTSSLGHPPARPTSQYTPPPDKPAVAPRLIPAELPVPLDRKGVSVPIPIPEAARPPSPPYDKTPPGPRVNTAGSPLPKKTGIGAPGYSPSGDLIAEAQKNIELTEDGKRKIAENVEKAKKAVRDRIAAGQGAWKAKLDEQLMDKKTLEEANKALKDDKARLEKEKAQLEEEKKRMAGEKKKLEEDKMKLEEERKLLGSSGETLRSKIAELEKTLKNAEANHASEKGTLTKENADLRAKMNNAKFMLETANGALMELANMDIEAILSDAGIEFGPI